MSRIGTRAIKLSDKITFEQLNGHVVVKGPLGQLEQDLPHGIKVNLTEGKLEVTRANDQIQTKAYHGLVRSLLNNMVKGVTEGYIRKLEMVGTGYRVRKQGAGIVLSVGFSHPVEFQAPEGIKFDTEGDTVIVISGIDKQKVGHIAAKIRDVRPPEPYKGKGIRYQGEIIRRKAGKATKAGA